MLHYGEKIILSEPKTQEKEIPIVNITLLSQRACDADSSIY